MADNRSSRLLCRGRFLIVNIHRVRQVVKLFGQSVDERYGFVTQLFHEAQLIYHAQQCDQLLTLIDSDPPFTSAPVFRLARKSPVGPPAPSTRPPALSARGVAGAASDCQPCARWRPDSI